MFRRSTKGSFNKTDDFLKSLSRQELMSTEYNVIKQYAEDLMAALAAATPVDTGLTSNSWTYTITTQNDKVKLQIYNSNVNDGCSIAILLQYGHATNNGGFVQGIDYINPVAQPYFDKIEEKVWREVTT